MTMHPQLISAIQRVQDWYQSREPRERIILSVGAVIVAITLLYGLLLAPLQHAVATRSARIEQKQKDLAWMRSVAPTIMASAPPSGGNLSGESMVVIIANSTSGSALASSLTGQTPEGPNGVRVRFENVSFDTLVVWLAALRKDYGIRTTSADITRTPQSGQVTASLTLERGL